MECTISLDIGDLAIVIIKDGILYLWRLSGLESATCLMYSTAGLGERFIADAS
jgi:hypothetical protein